MKKKILTAAVCCTLAFGLAACGGSSAGSSAGASSGTTASSGTAASSAGSAQEAKGTVDVGEFTVDVPAGWLGVTMSDYTEDADEDGNFPAATNNYCLIKGGESEWDSLDHPTMYIYYYDSTSAETQADWSTLSYDEKEEIDVSVNGKKCSAYHCKSDWSEEGEEGTKVYEYDVVLLPVSENSCIGFNIVAASPDFKESISASDSDVMGIMESVVVK